MIKSMPKRVADRMAFKKQTLHKKILNVPNFLYILYRISTFFRFSNGHQKLKERTPKEANVINLLIRQYEFINGKKSKQFSILWYIVLFEKRMCQFLLFKSIDLFRILFIKEKSGLLTLIMNYKLVTDHKMDCIWKVDKQPLSLYLCYILPWQI
ncbi:hypothetical protein BpHYR1_011356 [Brachionus plicatilis]|uniref:Uncharacterized protein n=1 Tax=Brachionus plicatilis TaxID=10195 RepID=A0A3M7SLZ7_BRAPC|nr:hypothetical protein BpHYR1_011356 [Brachionus plicatilis]